MAVVSVKHEDSNPTITQVKWNKDHIFAAGQAGNVMSWDATSPTKASWRAAIGLNEGTPTTDGTVAATMAADGAIGLRVKAFAGATTGAFIDGQTSAGLSRLRVD